MRFCERLKKLRKDLNINQNTMAGACGVQLSVISKYETENTKPSFEMLSKLALAYNINLNWLVNEIGSMFIETPERKLIKTGTNGLEVEVVEIPVQKVSVMEDSHSLDLNSDLKVDYYGPDNENYTKIYHKNGNVEYIKNDDVNTNFQNIVNKLYENCKDNNRFEFINTAIKALDDDKALAELKILIKGIEISKK